MQPLREEVDSVISDGGWAKASVGQLHKIDSFFRETQRYDGLGLGEGSILLPIPNPIFLVMLSRISPDEQACDERLYILRRDLRSRREPPLCERMGEPSGRCALPLRKHFRRVPLCACGWCRPATDGDADTGLQFLWAWAAYVVRFCLPKVVMKPNTTA